MAKNHGLIVSLSLRHSFNQTSTHLFRYIPNSFRINGFVWLVNVLLRSVNRKHRGVGSWLVTCAKPACVQNPHGLRYCAKEISPIVDDGGEIMPVTVLYCSTLPPFLLCSSLLFSSTGLKKFPLAPGSNLKHCALGTAGSYA